MTHEEARQKAVKLLRLSQSSNANEAALAASRAQEIMDRFKLDALSLAEADATVPEEPIQDFGDSPLDGKAQIWRARLAMVVCHANECKAYRKYGKTIGIIGRASDAETVRYMYGWMLHEVEALTEKYGRGMGKVWRNNFRTGVVETIAAKLKADKVRVQDDFVSNAGGGQALVRVQRAVATIQARQAAVDQWSKKNMHLQSSRASQAYNPNARAAGREAGKSIQIRRGGPGLGAARAQIGG